MKVSNAIKRLTKAGWTVSGEKGSYVATKEGHVITFFENGLGSDRCSTFTYSHKDSCAPTYGMNLKTAMSV